MNFIDALRDFQILGCSDQLKCSLACRVFFDLNDDESVTNIEKFYDSTLNLFYFCAEKNKREELFLPVSSCTDIDFIEVGKVHAKLCSSQVTKCINLAVCDTASTILYYRVYPGVLDSK